MEGEDKELKFNIKILVVGDAGVGKTAIIQKYVNNFYPEMYKQSLGCNFFGKKIEFPENASANLNIWDCSSDSLKSKMLKTYVYGSDAVLFVYDITNKASFESLPVLVNQVKAILNQSSTVQYAVLGNKSDLFNQIAVEEESAHHLCKILNIPYYSVSAKTGSNLNECFKIITHHICHIPLEEKKSDRHTEEHVPDLRAEVKGEKQASSSSSSCSIF